MSVEKEQVLEALRAVLDPDLHRDIVSLGFIKEIRIADGNVDFTIELTTPACPVRDQMKQEAERRVAALPGVANARATMTARVRSGGFTSEVEPVPGVKNVIVVGAGKGGVGKTSMDRTYLRCSA
jgi:ATP-binding protein involved in chromosome partitioning